MKGYKAFNADMTCREFQYEVGKTYEMESCDLCNYGFHFCKNITDCFKYYNEKDARFAEVEALGYVQESGEDSKCVTNKIRIVREIPYGEAVAMSNTGDWNTGNRNTGDWNTGDCNTGDWNTGDCNTGDWNTTSHSAGCFCTEEPKMLLFDKPSDMTLCEWRNCDAWYILKTMPQEIDVIKWIDESRMGEAEKSEHPTYKTIGGYLKVEKRNADKQAWWNMLSDKDKNVVKSLPNFDTEKFYKCTGVRAE